MLNRSSWRLSIPLSVLVLIASLIAGSNLRNYSYETSLEKTQINDQISLEIMEKDFPISALSSQTNEVLTDFVTYWAETISSRVNVISAEGTILADSSGNSLPTGSQLFRAEIQQALRSGTGSSVRNPGENNPLLFTAAPIRENGEAIAFLRIERSLGDAVQESREIRRRVVFLGVILAAAVLVFSYLHNSRMLQPIQRITQSAEEIEEGRRKFLPVIPYQEILGKLTGLLNRVLRNLLNEIQTLKSESVTLRTVLDQMTDGVVMVNDEGEITLMNPAAEEIFQTSSEKAFGHSVAEVLRQHQWIELWRSSIEYQREQSTSLEIPTQNTFLQGIAIPLQDTLPDHTLLLFQDLSKIRRLETTRQDFISNISHELRTPLASLKALTETLQDGALEDPPAANRFLSRIDTEIDALAQMVTELLELSRIESGQVPLDIHPVNPNSLLSKATDRMREQAKRKSISVEVIADPDLPQIQADIRRVEQVIVNLLHNAIKFSPRNGKIRLEAFRDQDQVIFSVQDQGPGIPEYDLERIFERFYKADRARTGGGTGLGLSISKHLIEAHEGMIWAESVLNEGSTFYFSLPHNNQAASV